MTTSTLQRDRAVLQPLWQGPVWSAITRLRRVLGHALTQGGWQQSRWQALDAQPQLIDCLSADPRDNASVRDFRHAQASASAMTVQYEAAHAFIEQILALDESWQRFGVQIGYWPKHIAKLWRYSLVVQSAFLSHAPRSVQDLVTELPLLLMASHAASLSEKVRYAHLPQVSMALRWLPDEMKSSPAWLQRQRQRWLLASTASHA